jgi:hypothetical protein
LIVSRLGASAKREIRLKLPAFDDSDFEAAVEQMLGDFVSAMTRLKRPFTTPRFTVAAAEHDFIPAAMMMLVLPMVGRVSGGGCGERNGQAKSRHGRDNDLFQHGITSPLNLFASTLPQEKRPWRTTLRAAIPVQTAFSSFSQKGPRGRWLNTGGKKTHLSSKGEMRWRDRPNS